MSCASQPFRRMPPSCARLAALALASALATGIAAQQPAAPPASSSTLITGARVLDAAAGRYLPPAAVLIENGRVARFAVQLPLSSDFVQLSGMGTRHSAALGLAERTDALSLCGAEDPVAGLVFSAPHRVDRLVVEGREVVHDGALVNADEDEIAREQRAQARRFAA